MICVTARRANCIVGCTASQGAGSLTRCSGSVASLQGIVCISGLHRTKHLRVLESVSKCYSKWDFIRLGVIHNSHLPLLPGVPAVQALFGSVASLE